MSRLPTAATNPSDASVTVVIPTYNERENLPALIPGILALGPNYRIIVVDDNSPDGTGGIADALAEQHPRRIEVVHRPRKEGIGPAYIAGFQAALDQNPAFIATMDADHSHSPADLARLVARANSADLVLGSRYVPGGNTRGWPWYRRAISRLGGLYARLVLGVPISDLTGGFKVYQCDALAALDLCAIESDGYVFQIETTYRLLQTGRQVVEEPITFTDRFAGKSKLSRRIVLEAMFMVWRLRWERLRGHSGAGGDTRL